jgi:hypothetical protein
VANPCAAAACNPCNPCAAGGASAELTGAEALAAYDCLLEDLAKAYGKSGLAIARDYQGWDLFSAAPYESSTHGGRYVHNYSSEPAYGRFEEAGVMPVGAMMAKDSFTVSAKGEVEIGPLFIMEKMASGFNPQSNDWRYTMVMPDGSIFGQTMGKASDQMQFCADCHLATETDSLFFMPEEARAK